MLRRERDHLIPHFTKRQKCVTFIDKLFMGSRGPKPVGTAQLMKYAEVWGDLFYRLRDGETGQLVRVKGKKRPIPVANVIAANRAATQELMKQLRKLRGMTASCG